MNSYFVQQKFGIDSLKILTLRIFHFLGEDFLVMYHLSRTCKWQLCTSLFYAIAVNIIFYHFLFILFLNIVTEKPCLKEHTYVCVLLNEVLISTYTCLFNFLVCTSQRV